MEKIKNLPVMRFVAFAVSVAIILGLSSVMLSFTVGAEDVTSSRVTLEDGTQVPTINGFSIIGSRTVTNLMFKYIAKNYGAGCVFLVAQDPNSKDVYYTRYPQFFIHGDQGQYVYRYTPSGSDSSVFDSNEYDSKVGEYVIDQSQEVYDYLSVAYDTSSKSYKACYNLSTLISLNFCSSSGEAISNLDYSSLNYYWCYSDLLQWNKKSALQITAISGFSDNSGFKEGVTPGISSSAKFVTCASFTNDDGSFPLWCKSFVAEGQQYPLFTYFIKDNGNKHKYSLVLSYNNNDLAGALCTALYDSITSEQWRNSVKVPSAQWFVANVMGTMHNAGDMIKKAAVNYFETGWKSATYSQSFNLNGSDMDFTDCADDGNKVYTLCLSDYSAIVKGQIYKVEIWDNTISQILDTTYFVSRDAFGKSNSGTGVKIYDYKDDGDRMEQDIINNTPSVTPGIGSDFKTTGDIEWSQFNDDLTNVDITSIFSSLHSAINSVGVFFQACWAIIPASIFAILLSGLSLIIVLRILGR